ncbi:hypothetical protein L345_04385, partial [Ophiophagus hannah]
CVNLSFKYIEKVKRDIFVNLIQVFLEEVVKYMERSTGTEKAQYWKTLSARMADGMRTAYKGHLTKTILSVRGIRQSCILAPSLFNLYINFLVACQNTSVFPPPKLAPRLITMLFYADDAVLLSQTPFILKCALRLFANHCTNDELTINYENRKMLVFIKCPGIDTWQLSEQKIKQTKVFRYLGIVLQASGQRNLRMPKDQSQQLKFFTEQKVSFFLTSCSKPFKTKLKAQLIYSVQLGPYNNYSKLEIVNILQVPCCVSNVTLCCEMRSVKIETKMWLIFFIYWLKLISFPIGLTLPPPMTLADNFSARWQGNYLGKIDIVNLHNSDMLWIICAEDGRNNFCGGSDQDFVILPIQIIVNLSHRYTEGHISAIYTLKLIKTSVEYHDLYMSKDTYDSIKDPEALLAFSDMWKAVINYQTMHLKMDETLKSCCESKVEGKYKKKVIKKGKKCHLPFPSLGSFTLADLKPSVQWLYEAGPRNDYDDGWVDSSNKDSNVFILVMLCEVSKSAEI